MDQFMQRGRQSCHHPSASIATASEEKRCAFVPDVIYQSWDVSLDTPVNMPAVQPVMPVVSIP